MSVLLYPQSTYNERCLSYVDQIRGEPKNQLSMSVEHFECPQAPKEPRQAVRFVFGSQEPTKNLVLAKFP